MKPVRHTHRLPQIVDLRCILLAGALAAIPVHGQTAAEPSTDTSADSTVEMSPFVVNTKSDRGYEAAYTLSGNRLNSQNRYVGTATTEITGALLKDLAIYDFQDVLNYVPNSAPAESGGLSSDPTGNESIFGVRYRVRGFLLTGFSRDFFISHVAPDAYNTERLSFERGPNSILFGIGEPGGVTNAVTAQAAFRNTDDVQARFDTWGSTRYSGSFNRVLLKDKLAVKVALLHTDQRDNRKPWHNSSNRQYAAVTYKPFRNTTLRANIEAGNVEILNSRAWAPSDGITVWQAAGSPAVPGNFLHITSPAAQPSLAQQAALGMQVFRTTPWQIMTVNGASPQTSFYQGQFELRPAQNNVPGFPAGSNGGFSFTNNNVLPMTANVLANGNKLDQRFKNVQVFLEQKIVTGLYFEAAYDHELVKELSDFSTGANDYIYVDLLPTLRSINPANPAALNGAIVPNPNYGKYFTYNDTPTSFGEKYDDDTVRGMLSYEYDFARHLGGRWGDILGHHNLSGLVEYYKDDYISDNYHLRNAVRASNATRYDVGSSWIGIQHYINIQNGDYNLPNFAALYPRIWQQNAADIPAANATGVAPMWLGMASTNTLSETTSRMVALQDFFWKDKIVTTLGWRTDGVDSWNLASTINTANGLRTDTANMDPKTAAKAHVSGNTMSKGIVVSPLSWLSAFYNESDNFHPANAGYVDIFGNGLPNESGKGKDYGLKVFLLGGKVSATFDWFKTNYLGQATRGPRAGPVGPFDAPRVAIGSAIQDYYTNLGTPQLADKWLAINYFPSVNNYYDTQDYAAKGYEFSLTANPTENWRVMVNVSKQNNVTSNVAPAMQQWAKFIRTALTDPVLLALPTTQLSADGSHYNTVADNLNLIDQRITEIKSLEGFADQRQPEYSANLVTAYDIKEGWLKNVGVGGSVRWRSHAVVGYQTLGNTTVLDATHPYWNHATSSVGLFASYRVKLVKGITSRIQVNVDNVFNSDRSNVLLSRQVNGQRVDSRWALFPGRSWALSLDTQF